MKINFIGVPLFYGCDREGVENGPKTLRENGAIKVLEENNIVFDMGDIFVNKCPQSDKYKTNKNLKYLDEIIEVNTNLANNVYLSLLDNSFPLVVGGDHSLALGSIAGSAKYYKDDLAIIWIDAHGDFNTDETTPSGNIHGMPLAASSGFGINELKNLYFEGRKIKTENIFLLCVRDLDEGEINLLNQNKVKMWSTENIKKNGIDKTILEVFNEINNRGINNIHVSFDVDSINPESMPGTGTRVKNGIELEEAKRILKYILESGKVRVMDFVEFNPKLDKDNISLNNCLDMIKYITYKLK